MRICVDLDGVVAQLKGPGQSYSQVAPVPGAREKLDALRKAGHYIILHTARHMKSCGGNVGLVVARIGGDTLNWLSHHQIPFDEIVFGKPWADVYVDDNGFRFTDWNSISSDGCSLPNSSESQRSL